MTDVFKARFDGREWWARATADAFVNEFATFDLWPLGRGIGSSPPSLVVPTHMVERVEELPPEPPVGTVLYDKDDDAWMRDYDLWTRFVPGESVDEAMSHKSLVRLRGPLHPYPKSARDEIARLAAERDELQWRIDRALSMVAQGDFATTLFKQGRILRGES